MLFPKPLILIYGNSSHEPEMSESGYLPVENQQVRPSEDESIVQSELFQEPEEQIDLKRRINIKTSGQEKHNQKTERLSGSALESHKQSDTNHEENAGEIFVHQFIETIEFVLGSVSNTASYLRLWALSLAHRQLAVVFYDMLVKPQVAHKSGVFWNIFGLMFGFTFFIILTFGVLMMMDLLECFLHALRLHWYSCN